MTAGPQSVFGYKQTVDQHLTSFLRSEKRALRGIPWAEDVINRLIPFATSGKTVRGSLVVFSYRMFQNDTPTFVRDAASALELFQSGLLIHDDIMDKATIRRKLPTIHSQYEQYAASEEGNDIAHFGISQAINTADFCYFLGYKLLASAGNDVEKLVSHELGLVALAQMQDVASGHLPKLYSETDIQTLYRLKTARYTFSLPFLVGATLAKAENKISERLSRLGEALGMLFQIRDDELGIEIDTINHKQTLRTVMSPKNLEAYRRKQRIEAETLIRSLPIADTNMRELLSLLRFCEEREK